MASIKARETTRGSRYDVRYRLSTGQVRTRTVRTKAEARAFAATVEADKARGGLIDPRAGRITLSAYATCWIDDRPDLRPKTVELYRSLLRLHIEPTLGAIDLGRLDVATVRRWHSAKVKAGRPGPNTVAKAYRLLRTILNTAVADGLIVANPCQIARAGVERATERPVATPAEVWALAGAVARERRLMVLLAGFCGLRLGEVLGLARRHVDPLHATILIERQMQELGKSHHQTLTEPKSDKGRRTVRLPATIAAEVDRHLKDHTATDPDAFLFTGAKGSPLRRCVWSGEWATARKATGNPDLRYHDLRHSALTLMAATGATVAELQDHAGHASSAAALRYQHATRDRAAALAALVEQVITASATEESATVRAMDAR